METSMAGFPGRRTSAFTRARPILAGVLGLSLAACGGGGGGGGATPVTGVSPAPAPAPAPSPGIGPTLPVGVGDGSAYPAFISASTIDASLGQSFIQAPSVTGPGISFNPGSTDINAVAAFQTVQLRAADLAYQDGVVQTFQSSDNTFIATLVRLDHVAFSSWARLIGGGALQAGAAAGGIQTPGAQVPVSGTAEYQGVASGVVATPATDAMFAGQATLTANFGARTISGSITNARSIDFYSAQERSFNSIALNGSWTPGASSYTGTATTGTSPGGPNAMPAGASGPMAGAFFGSGAGAARETGGTFSITSPGNGVVHGSFGGRR